MAWPIARKIETEHATAGTFTWYIVKGDHGAVQFLVLQITRTAQWHPLDLGVHSRTPLFLGHAPTPHCPVLTDACFCSPSFDMAIHLWSKAQATGHPVNAIWRELEAVYDTLYTVLEDHAPGIHEPPLVSLPWTHEERQKAREGQAALVRTALERMREERLEGYRRECSSCANLERYYVGDYVCWRCRDKEGESV